MKSLVNEGEINTLAHSYVVNCHDKNLEKLAEEIKVVTIEENIKLNMEVKADYANLGKELEFHYEKHHNEQQTSHTLQQIDILRNKIAEKLINDPVVRKEVEDSVDKNIEMLKEQSRVYSRRLFRLQRMLLSEDQIEQLAYNKATDNKEKELSRQKDYIDKLHEEYVQKKEQLKTMLDDDKKDNLVKETEKLERRIYNKQMFYNETCSRYQEKYTDDYVRRRYVTYKKEYADFNSRINEKIAEVTAAKEFNKELRTELGTIKREVLRTDYEPQQHKYHSCRELFLLLKKQKRRKE